MEQRDELRHSIDLKGTDLLVQFHYDLENNHSAQKNSVRRYDTIHNNRTLPIIC
jgi:hypothetical protein